MPPRPAQARRAQSASWYARGTRCWAPDPQRAFVEAIVLDVKDGAATVCLGSEVPTEALDEASDAVRSHECRVLLPRANQRTCLPDMDDLPELNMATVLDNVEVLFSQQQSATPGAGLNTIYSSVGPVLIAMNPYSQLPIYSQEWVDAYHEAGFDAEARKRLGPHCYGIAEQALSGLRAVRQQSVVICGESGAGKTYSIRKMLEYLLKVAQKKEGSAEKQTNTQNIVHASEVLESFGNAATVHNNNASRFGKFTELHFDLDAYTVQGCVIQHYLLERSRIVSQSCGERNYHIFYQLLRSDVAGDYMLEGGPEAYRYTQEGCAMNFNDAARFNEISEAMEKAGFVVEQRRAIFEAVAGVLHLGNVEVGGDRDKGVIGAEGMKALAKAAQLLGVETSKLDVAMTRNVIKAGKDTITKQLGKEAVEAQRDAVAKMIYAKTFDRLVANLNAKLMRRNAAAVQGRGLTKDADQTAVVGLLDIFGFEDIPVNGFEQMFINLTNERIQLLFNAIMFQRELEAYRREGVPNAFDPGPGNLPCIELFVGNPGIVRMLSDQCNTSGLDGDAFVTILNRTFAKFPDFGVCDPQKVRAKQNRLLGEELLDYRDCFEIKHYVCPIIYTVKDFVPKSRDALLPHLAEVLRDSTKPDLRQLFSADGPDMAMGKTKSMAMGKTTSVFDPSRRTPTIAPSKESTVGEKFVKQLEVLSANLEQGNCHFVRCIKSNARKIPGIVDRPLVLQQLTSGGVVAALQMRQRGYPNHFEFHALCSEFCALEVVGAAQWDMQKRCMMLLNDFVGSPSSDQYAMGSSKVFLKNVAVAQLRGAMGIKLTHVVNLVRRRWREHKGTERIRSVEESWARFQGIERRATEQGVARLNAVAPVLAEGRKVIGDVSKALEAAKAEHGADVRKIGVALQPHAQNLPKFRGQLEMAQRVVERHSARKATAEHDLASRLAHSNQEAMALLTRLKKVGEDIADLDPEKACAEELERSRHAVAEARTRLTALCEHEIPELQQGGLAGIGVDLDNLSEGITDEHLAGPYGRLEEAKSFVKQAEESAFMLLQSRRDFAEASITLQEQRAASRTKLEALALEAQDFIADGLDGIGEVFDSAWRKDAEVENLLRSAKDLPAFQEAAEQFVRAVVVAEHAIQSGRDWKARRKLELAQQESSTLRSAPGYEDLQKHGTAFLQSLAVIQRDLQTRNDEANPTDRMFREESSEEKLLKVMRVAKEMIENLGISAPTEDEELEEEEEPDWATHQTHQICEIGEEEMFRGKAKLLDKDTCVSITSACDALNKGLLFCPDGMCVIHSRSRQAYFLVWSKDMETQAFERFAIEHDD